MKQLKKLFAIEQSPAKGLMALEWLVLGYMLVTLIIVLFAYTKEANPNAMIMGRLRIGVTTVALWLVYRMVPCRLTRLARVAFQFLMLGWWYGDTFEINRMFPNLDHFFAGLEQTIFGCQPALFFSEEMPGKVFSELMCLGYVSYFPLIMITLLFYFCFRYKEFERSAFVILASFFAFYVIFILLPVTGPQYYYGAVGIENIGKGIFPNLYDYFNLHQDRMVTPGWQGGFFYGLVEEMHDAGEHPTAAFPSSHVGVTMVLLLLAWHSKNRKLFFFELPFFVLMCFATVYIRAHYVIDAIAGLFVGAVFYVVFMYLSKNFHVPVES